MLAYAARRAEKMPSISSDLSRKTATNILAAFVTVAGFIHCDDLHDVNSAALEHTPLEMLIGQIYARESGNTLIAAWLLVVSHNYQRLCTPYTCIGLECFGCSCAHRHIGKSPEVCFYLPLSTEA